MQIYENISNNVLLSLEPGCPLQEIFEEEEEIRKAACKPFMVSRPMNKFHDENLTAFLVYLLAIKKARNNPRQLRPTTAY